MDVVKPKRGRKPKNAQPVIATPVINDTPTDESPTEEVKQKSRRGRKPKVVYNTLETNTEIMQSTSDDENIIMRLNIMNTKCLNDESSSYPNAYSEIYDDSFLSKPCDLNNFSQLVDDTNVNVNMNINNINEGCNSSTIPMMSSMKEIDNNNVQDNSSMRQEGDLRVVELLKDFEEKNKNNEWPSTTSIHCYWCCHKFTNAPFGIPIKFTDNKFHVYGCFCSLECASAFNFASKESIDEIWERYNLINLLSRKLGSNNIIKPAPNRLALKMFGGHLDIDQYRSYFNTSKIININFPPMLSLTQQIEEINESDINNDYKYIPIDTERINKYKEKIKLKRSKPLTNFENTLDHAMNLKFGN